MDVDDDARTIGARVRMIRRRRGLSLDVVAGLAGITKTYLSMLELGQRGFNRRGLIEDLADALGCSVADVTGQPYPAPDRATKDAGATLTSIRLALNDFGPTDVPDVTPRPLDALTRLADEANEHCGQAHYCLARHDVGRLLVESQASALTVPTGQRNQAFTAAVTTCFVAGVVSSRAGNIDLAATVARQQHADDAHAHLDQAAHIAARAGERNALAARAWPPAGAGPQHAGGEAVRGQPPSLWPNRKDHDAPGH
ncbi:MAG: helix-turn-helix domain-containing protein [Pseudonocardiaceae bacterium]